ncbi:lysosomal acid glucosylceramidase-like [Belonocnema kinseyi]|uniref:lysosomal acid glucosylceramidase-like n=1 Tax=Belonocnema kinseyi TaxID=2817044 RepID=UPI00143DA422|nr:lysosomal acid glucosylceramidase-like [Belonocnema kinseyi]XP_033207314.1 lysosomal acid glucosylceramidase-like [Belonocnema kinseyi]XP_033207322.1 lysosomal acid glucosylceramidase-like [Belonocnema kinseyi]XP_033207332.1 lysosomal acid glucosylceramidase-like [Belonocnema kinseyi]
MHKLLKMLFFLAFVWIAITAADECIPRDFGKGSIVCVCNSTYCDSTPETSSEPGTFLWYVSSNAGQRMELTTGKIGHTEEGSTILTLNPEKRYQAIQGFGGAFTDSAAINIKSLSDATQQKLLETYFTREGSRYNLGRIPIGGTDFSTRFYTYDDIENDILLKKFSLAPEDTDYKIPLIQSALQMNPDLRFFSAAWTAPMWMKTNNNSFGFGFLKKEYYQLYADYLLRFLDEYKKQGIDMWAISTGNEPSNAYVPIVTINNMGWTAGTVATWVAENLGPSLDNSQHNQTLILGLDDQRFNLPWFIDLVFRNKVAEKYISGVAIHWYWDSLIPAVVLDKTHNHFPKKFLLMTEACEGSLPWQLQKVILGSWERAESTALKMFENMNHWVTGWVDWNLALDKVGGPNWNENNVDAPIIVDPETDEFFKQPMYYAIHHFSRFLPRGSVRLELEDSSIIFRSLTSIAFETPENKTVVLIYNRSSISKKVDIVDPRNGVINLELPALSMNTILY